MVETLKQLAIYFDELDKIRILDPDVANQTNQLKDECRVYLEKIREFQRVVDNFIVLLNRLGVEVEKHKMKAIGARNLLQTMEKQQEMEQQQLQALITEKSMELERLKVYTASLQRIEMEQNEIINNLIQK